MPTFLQNALRNYTIVIVDFKISFIEISPNESRIVQLENDDESDGDEDEGEVDEDHEAADAPGVGTERVGRRHGLHHHARLRRVLPHVRRARRVALAALRTKRIVIIFSFILSGKLQSASAHFQFGFKCDSNCFFFTSF